MARVTSFIIRLLAVFGLVGADMKTSDFILSKKEDIKAWNEYFPGRGLQEEWVTNRRAIDLTANVPLVLRESLEKMVQYPRQELGTAQMLMEGTSAQECVKGISYYLEDIVNNEVANFIDCIADVPPNLQRLIKSWTQINDTYQSIYQNALAGIDNCARTYPNKASQSRLISCVNTCTTTYFSRVTANFNAQNSPSMTLFTNKVVECAETAAKQIVQKVLKFLGMLLQCSKLSDNVDTQAYEAQMKDGFNYYIPEIDLSNQMFQGVGLYSSMISGIQQKMVDTYNLKKSALEKYVIETKDISIYIGYIRMVLRDYLVTISSTASDFPANSECVSSANSIFDGIVSAGAEAALQCDKDIVDQIKYLIKRVEEGFAGINKLLPNYGNAAMLGCFSKSYIFAEHTLINCYKLAFEGFRLNITDISKAIDSDIDVLERLASSLFNSISLPCVDSLQSKLLYDANNMLYEMERCLYMNTGAKYSVTTYYPGTPETTTVTPT